MHHSVEVGEVLGVHVVGEDGAGEAGAPLRGMIQIVAVVRGMLQDGIGNVGILDFQPGVDVGVE